MNPYEPPREAPKLDEGERVRSERDHECFSSGAVFGCIFAIVAWVTLKIHNWM